MGNRRRGKGGRREGGSKREVSKGKEKKRMEVGKWMMRDGRSIKQEVAYQNFHNHIMEIIQQISLSIEAKVSKLPRFSVSHSNESYEFSHSSIIAL